MTIRRSLNKTRSQQHDLIATPLPAHARRLSLRVKVMTGKESHCVPRPHIGCTASSLQLGGSHLLQISIGLVCMALSGTLFGQLDSQLCGNSPTADKLRSDDSC